jgi:ribonuclease BN (tRNA processing enzyme)
MFMIRQTLICVFFFLLVGNIASAQTQLVLLGTGTPNPDPDRSGPSLAIVVNNQSYVVDCGPGVVRRAEAAAKKYGIAALKAAELKKLFITHLHSDHTLGLADFIFTPAVLERDKSLEIFGPAGTNDMTQHIRMAYQQDIDIRLNGLEKGNPVSYQVRVHEINEGVVYRDSNIVVTAFKVDHGAWPNAFGYRFETKDKVIVISGDATYSENLVKYAQNCDWLVHEIYSAAALSKREQRWKDYHSRFHTSPEQLAKIANTIRPKQVILTHQLLWSSTKEGLLDEIRKYYTGTVVYGNDLDIFR